MEQLIKTAKTKQLDGIVAAVTAAVGQLIKIAKALT